MDHYLPMWPQARAFGANARKRLQREVNNPSFARIHGIQLEGLTGALHAFGGGACHHLQFFCAKCPVTRTIEKNLVMKRRFKPQRAMGEMFDGLKKFGTTLQQ